MYTKTNRVGIAGGAAFIAIVILLATNPLFDTLTLLLCRFRPGNITTTIITTITTTTITTITTMMTTIIIIKKKKKTTDNTKGRLVIWVHYLLPEWNLNVWPSTNFFSILPFTNQGMDKHKSHYLYP